MTLKLLMTILMTAIFSFLVMVGCDESSAEDNVNPPDKAEVTSGKEDGLDLCTLFGFQQGCDLCTEFNWYADGECDQNFIDAGLCVGPDLDCFNQGDIDAIVERVLSDHGIEGITAAFPLQEVLAQMQQEFSNAVSFEDALGAAIDSFLNDGQDPESPLMIVEDVDEEPCISDNLTERVRCWMNRSSSVLAIVYRDGQVHDGVYPPEVGESIAENWVFFLKMSDLSDHLIWAIVDRSGQRSTYNYGFN